MKIVDIVEVNRKNGMVTLNAKCPLCGRVNELVVNAEEYDNCIKKYNSGSVVQSAFPTWNADQREFILTGNCPCIWG